MENNIKGFELSPLQKRTWRLQADNGPLYSLASFRITGVTDPGSIKTLLEKQLEAHDIFQTRFEQVVHMQYPFQVPGWKKCYEIQVTDISLEERDMQTVITDNLFESLAAGTEPAEEDILTEIAIVKTRPAECLLLIKINALSGDTGVIMNIVNDLLAAIDGLCELLNNENYPYVQFAQWQQELMDENNEEAEQFWLERRNNQEHHHQLPFSITPKTDDKRSSRPLTLSLDINAALQTDIKHCCTEQSVTPAVLLKTAWTILLADYMDYTGNFVIGSVENGRHYDAFTSINGPLFKTVPFRTTLAKTDTIQAVLQRVAAETEMIAESQDYYFNIPGQQRWQDAVKFDLLFEYHELQHPLTIHVKALLDGIYVHTEPCSLKLFCYEYSPVGLVAELYYDPTVLNNAQALLIRERFTYILQQLTGDGTGTLADIRNCTQQEYAHIVDNMYLPGITVNNDPAALSIPAYFESLLPAVADRPAVGFKHKLLTYAELNEKANAYAHHLIRRYGIKPGDVVAFQIPRSVDMVVVIMGILAAGAAFLPLDIAAPEERVKFILQDSAAKVLITQSQLIPALKGITQHWALEDGIGGIETLITAPQINISPASAAYLIYTSGSTGKPKGVLISHAALLNYSRWFSTVYDITSEDTSVLFSSIAFDLGFTNLWPLLLSGGQVQLLEETQLLDTAGLCNLLSEKGVTVIKLTPSHFNLLLNEPGFDDMAPDLKLKLIVLGGEAIRPQDLETYFALNPSITFVNHYGPTETTIGTASRRIKAADFQTFRQSPVIGKPVTGNSIFILDEQHCILPYGSTGEICVAGAGLAIGYLNGATQNQEKFIAHPLDPAAKLYKTGDVGRYTLNGEIQFLGRKDFQVKINGYRIEPEEIRNVLILFPEIQDAAVLYVPQATGEGSLAAYFSADEPLEKNKIQEFLTRHLPQYMIPAYFVQVSAIPLTPNGKIDRKALLELPLERAASAEYVEPEKELEKQIARLWKEILCVNKIGIHDNFFDLGGNSLKLILMLRELSKIFPGKVTLTDLFRYNTISSIIRFLGQEEPEAAVAGFEI
ncbi:non-ribosomal peptide synthetase [Chitinophaga pinensis]|uniref:Amino acid adenylation domain protein n=1 Tax=Chitinophaga pinensis (strain ATCC 43595 / DSM 2588 / LMG 13176 / NBRC 15968 / NCIMB 11800 / UQM 2034) TaxID=485918 RepID=A0A979GV80_CHIPD|nr:non-ribosomal peptide synthetase [Chitinophaga pinensis]ACU60876.1 amino acid adenylation domain protein [Chitinophaga pinensis DSM 2588]